MKQQGQRGQLSLFWVAVASAGIALLAMAALFSMRYDRNLFKEAYAKVAGMVSASPAGSVVEGAKQAVGAAAPAASAAEGPLRKCTIDGKTVISNIDCSAKNPTSKEIKVQHMAGIESPKMPASASSSASATSDPALDKAIDKQLR